MIQSLIADIQKLVQGNCKAGFEKFCTNNFIVHTRCFTILQPRYGSSQFLDCKGACIHLYGFFAVVKLVSFRTVSFFTIPIQDFIEMFFHLSSTSSVVITLSSF